MPQKSFLVIIYTNDILISGANNSDSLNIVKNMDKAQYSLGVEILQKNEGILLTQTKCIVDMLTNSELSDEHTVSSPLLYVASIKGLQIQTIIDNL